jgi:hypothetical protein
MSERTLKSVKENIVAQFNRDYPEERLYGKVFSLYILDRYAKLMYRIYKKAEK